MKWQGRLEHVDIEGGVWKLHAPNGVFTLRGMVPPGLVGQEVSVEGERDESFGFDMSGPAISVRSVSPRK